MIIIVKFKGEKYVRIPDNLDEAVLKGYNRAKKEERKSIVFNKITLAAAAIILGIIGAGTIGFEKVNAYSIIENIFDYFKEGEYKQNLVKYKEIGNDINLKVEDKGIEINLNKIVIDDNILVASLTVKSDKLRGYDNTEKIRDFIDMEYDLQVNGESPQSDGINVSMIDEKTAAVILEADVSRIILDDLVNIDFNIRRITRGSKKIASGKWDFSVKVNKGDEVTAYEINKNLFYNSDLNLSVNKLLVTPIESKLYLEGKVYNYDAEDELNISSKSEGIDDFIVRGNNGQVLLTESTSGIIDMDGNFNYEFKILSDLSQKEYIDIIKASGNKALRGENNNYILRCSSSSKNGSLNREYISRKPTEKELKDGYGLDSVSYNVDIDKDTAFESIDELRGKEIFINKDSKVIVNDLKITDNYTELIFKLEGSYDYRLLGNVVLFDENMKDYCAYEGASTTIIDIENKIVSVQLTKADLSKKYTIGVPEVSDLILDEEKKVTVRLK